MPVIGGIALDAHWWWMILALLLCIAEIVVPGFFLIWLGAAALLAGFVTLLTGIGAPLQFAVFAVAAIGAVYAGRRYLSRNPGETSDPLLNDRAARLVGQTVLVVEQIEEGGAGRVRVGDGVWPARGAAALVGERVRIEGADGAVLIVGPITNPT